MRKKPAKADCGLSARIEHASLRRALDLARGVVERGTLAPIRRHVKLAADEGLELVATDLDLTLVAREPAEVARAGATTVPAHTLFDIVRKLPEGATVALEQAPGASELRLAAGRACFALPTLPPDEFPATPGDEPEVRFEIAPADLAKLIDKTSFAISTEGARFYLNGIYFHVAGAGATRTLSAVASDGHQLAMVDAPLPPGAERMPSVIVPRKTVRVLRKLLNEAEDQVSIAVSEVRLAAACAGVRLISRLIDGEYPDYRRVIPTGNERVAILATRPFAEVVDRVAAISTEKTRPMKLAFEAGRVTVSANGPEQGRAREELDCDWRGEPFEIGLNARYVLNIVSRIEGPELMLAMDGPRDPALIRDPLDQDTLFVLMPMHVA